MMNRLSQSNREALVRESLGLDDRLVWCLAEWVGRDLSGVDWQLGLPWRIENQITSLLKEINQRLEKPHE
jgi:hypothetical protein